MLTDASLQFSTLQAITSTAASTNIADLTGKAQGVDWGVAMTHLQFAIYVGTAFVTGGGATLQVQVQGAPDNGSGAPGTYTTITETDALAASVLTANAKIPIDLTHRAAGQVLYRFLRLNYVVGTSTFSAGTLSALLVIDRDDWDPMALYPNGYVVGA